jgi:hypothetical protein
MKDDWKQQICDFYSIVGCAIWHNESDKTMSQLGMRKSEKQYVKGRKICCNMFRGCHQREIPDKFYIINQQKDMI